MAESAAAAPGIRLGGGRYQLERLIGTGGMASVWRATDRRLHRPVAIKLISEDLAREAAYAERFAREARTAAGLTHANLVCVYDYGADDGRPYLVMEYVDGGTLADRLDRSPVVGREAAALAGDLLAALACIHAAGIVHRDIKPANVLLSSDGRARITDFGIAHPAGAAHLTETGHVLGTLRYLAPEVIDGQPATPRSDLYSLGVLLADLSADRGDPTTRELVAQLTERAPGRRPPSAEQARELLPGGATPRTAAEPTRREPQAAPDSGVATRREPRSASRRAPRIPAAAPPASPPSASPPAARRAPRPPAPPAAPPAPPRGRRGAAVLRPRRRRVGRILTLLAVAGVVVVGAVALATRPGAAPATTHGSTAGQKTGLTARLDELDQLVRAAGR